MYLIFLAVSSLIAIVYYLASPCFFWYVKNGTRSELKKCGWFLFVGFICVSINLIILTVMILFQSILFQKNLMIMFMYLANFAILIVFTIWLGSWGTVLLPDLLSKFRSDSDN